MIRREINSDFDVANVLSYFNDTFCTNNDSFASVDGRAAVRYDNTIAIGLGSTYAYPKAMFTDGKQIYPPLIACNPNSISYVGNTWNLNIGRMYAQYGYPADLAASGVVAKAYLFKNIFQVEYANTFSASQVHRPENIQEYANTVSLSSTTMPSFVPATQSTQTKYAYVSGSNVMIRDTVVPYKIPEFNSDGQYIYNSTSWNNTYLSELRITLNQPVKEEIQRTYDTVQAPIAYTYYVTQIPNRTTQILRRGITEVSADGMTESNYVFGFTTKKIVVASSTTYYKFNVFYNGALIDSETRIPMTPVLSTGRSIFNAFSPFVTGWTNDNAQLGNYRFLEYAGATVLNLFLVQVNSTQATNFVNIVRQKSLNIGSFKINTTNSQLATYTGLTIDYSRTGGFGYDVEMSSGGAGFMHFEGFVGNTGFKIYRQANQTTPKFPSISIGYGRNTGFMSSTTPDSFQYYTYAQIWNSGSGIVDANYTKGSEQSTSSNYLHIGINVNDNTTLSASTITASNSTSYTYYFIGADILCPVYNNPELGMTDTIYFKSNRYFSTTYICVKSAQYSSGTGQTYFVTSMYGSNISSS